MLINVCIEMCAELRGGRRYVSTETDTTATQVSWDRHRHTWSSVATYPTGELTACFLCTCFIIMFRYYLLYVFDLFTNCIFLIFYFACISILVCSLFDFLLIIVFIYPTANELLTINKLLFICRSPAMEVPFFLKKFVGNNCFEITLQRGWLPDEGEKTELSR